MEMAPDWQVEQCHLKISIHPLVGGWKAFSLDSLRKWKWWGQVKKKKANRNDLELSRKHHSVSQRSPDGQHLPPPTWSWEVLWAAPSGTECSTCGLSFVPAAARPSLLPSNQNSTHNSMDNLLHYFHCNITRFFFYTNAQTVLFADTINCPPSWFLYSFSGWLSTVSPGIINEKPPFG